MLYVARVRISFFFRPNDITPYGWTMFRFAIHPSMDTCNSYVDFSCLTIFMELLQKILWIKSFAINFSLKLFILKKTKTKKKGTTYMSFTCVQELIFYGIHYLPCMCAMCVRVPVCTHVLCLCVRNHMEWNECRHKLYNWHQKSLRIVHRHI